MCFVLLEINNFTGLRSFILNRRIKRIKISYTLIGMITLLFKLLCVVVGLNYKLQNGRKIGLSLESYDHSARVYRYTLE